MQMTDHSTKHKQTALRKNTWAVETVDGLPLVFSPLLKKYSNLVHAFSTRKGGKTPPPRESFNISMSVGAAFMRPVESKSLNEVSKENEEHLRIDARANRKRLCDVLDLP